jgi:hypothetical protein
MNLSFLNLTDSRKTDSHQLWIAGCSFAHGIGIQREQRFGHLLAEKLNLPVSYLTRPGTSISWAADQILRSDIKKNDVVVWALTGAGRFTFLDDKNILYHIGAANYKDVAIVKNYINEKLLASNHMLYESFTHIGQVKNYLDKIGAEFILAVMPLNGQEHDLQTIAFTEDIKNSIVLFDQNDYSFIDYGFDRIHPGPLHHKWYADQIYSKYTDLYK